MSLLFILDNTEDSIDPDMIRTLYTNTQCVDVRVGSTRCLLDMVISTGSGAFFDFTEFLDIIEIQLETFAPIFAEEKPRIFGLFNKKKERLTNCTASDSIRHKALRHNGANSRKEYSCV